MNDEVFTANPNPGRKFFFQNANNFFGATSQADLTGPTGVAYTANTPYEVKFDFLGKTNSDDWYRDATFTVQLWAGNVGSGTLLGTFTDTTAAGQDTSETNTFTTAATASGSGDLTLFFSSSVPTVEGFRQAFIDNIEISIVPEPATLALAGLGAVAVFMRRRSA